MTYKLTRTFRENIFLIGGLVWILFWLLPWPTWLDALPWIRLGISILLFAAPGMGISLLLVGKRFSLSTHFTSGLAFSVLLVGSLGFLGRVLNLPFRYINPVFAITGLIILVVLTIRSRLEHPLYKPKSLSMITLALLLFMVSFGILTNFQNRLLQDDLSYLAHLTNWQHAEPLGFQDIIFGSENFDQIRFWFAMFPMALAFLAEISNLHGLLLLGVYLEPYLMIIAILAIYNFYEDFLAEDHLAIAAVLLQFTFLVLMQGERQPGNALFYRLSEDKAFAAFILAPMFFLGMRHFLESFTFRSGIFVFFSGLSLTLTHPIILAYSLFIAGLYTSIVTIRERNYTKFGVSMTLLLITVLPAVFLRFIDGPLTTRYAVNLELARDVYGDGETRFSYIEGTPFYGFDLQRIKIQIGRPQQESLLEAFFSWSYLWLLGLGFLWSIFNLKKKMIAPFIAATTSLVLLCGIPFTGWLLGYFVTAGMLWRSPWLLPIGLIGVVLIADLIKFVSHKITATFQSRAFNERFILGLTSILCLALIASVSARRYNMMSLAILDQSSYRRDLNRLVGLGNYLEDNIEQASVFVAPLEVMNFLPGLSSKAKVVYFRSPRFSPRDVDVTKIAHILSPDPSVPMKQRLNILKRYRVQYLLIEDRSLRDYYAGYTNFFNIQEIEDFWIVELKDSSS